jgi:dihydroneopterin aldolase
MNAVINITGVKAFGYHGVFDCEKEKGQDFIVDLEIHGDFLEAALTDQLEDTQDYSAIIELTVSTIESTQFNLIEKLSLCIGENILNTFEKVSKVKVTVHKPHAPVQADFQDISFTLTLERE